MLLGKMAHLGWCIALCAILGWSKLPVAAQTTGPGLPNLTYSTGQLFTVIGRINSAQGAPRGHGFVAMYNGYLFVIFSNDGGGGNGSGGFAFVDISTPSSPTGVFTTHNNPAYAFGTSNYAGDIREPHAFSFSGNYICIPTRRGLQFWDFTLVGPPANAPVKVGEIGTLPGVGGGDYSPTPWWVCWQGGRYVYVAGTSTGLHIVDASDPANPVMVDRGGAPNPIPTNQLGGFRVGTAFAIGNLLVLTGNDVGGIATLDISDPVHPVLLDTIGSGVGYSAMVNGNWILGAHDPARFWNIADPTNITFLGYAPDSGGKGGYGVFQDGYFHLGSSSNYAKIDIRQPGNFSVVGRTYPSVGGTDMDFGTAIGNLAFGGDDHGQVATFITPHQSEPDTTGPSVNMINPVDGAVNQALTSRVGVTFTEMVDIESIDTSTFIVRPIGGQPLPGSYSHQTGIVNFWPDEPLDLDKTYEVVIPAGGIKDFLGNGVEQTFTSLFTTGSEVLEFNCELQMPGNAMVGDPLTFDATCEGMSDPMFSWNFGDATFDTDFSTDPEISHTYNDSGHFTVLLHVDTSTGLFTFSEQQTVRFPTTPNPPTHAGSITKDTARQRVWNVNPDNNTVTATDIATLTKVFERPVGNDPRTLAVSPHGEIWVANKDDGTLSILDGDTGESVGLIELPYGSRPHGVVFAPNGNHAYVTLQGLRQVAKIDPVTRAVLDYVFVGREPRGIAVSHDGTTILVTRFISPETHGEVVEIDANTFTVSNTYALAFDPGPDTEASGRGVPNYLMSVTISPDGRKVWIPSKKDNTARGGFLDGEPLNFENTVRAIVSQIDLVDGMEDLAAREDLNDRALPSSVTFTPSGDYAFVTTLGSNTLDVLDFYSGELVTSIVDIGLAPLGSVLDDATGRLFVHNYMSREIVVYDVTDVGAGNQTPELARIPSVVIESLSPQVLRGKQVFYNAADNRMSRDNYLSCAMCHLDGGSDERVYDFTDRGEGLRNTISLIGRAAMRHGPVHWSGNFDEVHDFENDIRGEFDGDGLMSDDAFFDGSRNDPLGNPKAGFSEDLDAMVAYVASLEQARPSPYRQADGMPTADAIAGSRLFHSAETGCASCHIGQRHTDSSLTLLPFTRHNVGTLGPGSGNRRGVPLDGLDTPTLQGLWESAPYLHDGSAATLMDVLTTKNPTDQHGNTSHLTTMQLNQLVAYMLELEKFAGPDVDGDFDVDQKDFGLIQSCLTGSLLGPPLPGCEEADIDQDGDVDQFDVQQFELCQAGSGVAVLSDCQSGGQPNGQAFDPVPGDLATDVNEVVTLSWQSHSSADHYRVYFGTENPPPFVGTSATKTLELGQLDYSTSYFWRVDSVNGLSVTTGDVWSFTVVAAVPIEITNLNRYELGTFTSGTAYFIDRSFTIQSLPTDLDNSLGIRTANNDKGATSTDWITFDVNQPVDVYVAYDRRGTSLPNWMTGFVDTGEIVTVTDSAGYHRVYRKQFEPPTVTLGGNSASGASGAQSNYFVLIRRDGE